MIEGGTQHLNLGGKLIFVVQRRLKMEGLLSAHFETVEVLADSDIYRAVSYTHLTLPTKA